jgi:hypothetical protein
MSQSQALDREAQRIIVPMNPLFNQADRVMDLRLRPLHYADIAEIALTDLHLTKREVNWLRVKEDIREKMFERNWEERGYIYLGRKCGCFGLKRAWLPELEDFHQLTFLQPCVRISGNARSATNAIFEALMRGEHMDKKEFYASDTVVFAARAKGLAIEQHVRDWFQRTYPEFFLPPANEGRWKDWCAHDFALRFEGHVYRIDVFGRNRWDQYVRTPGKGRTEKQAIQLSEKERNELPHWHIAATIVDTSEGADVVMEGIFSSENYATTEGVLWMGQAVSPQRLIFRLNCAKYKNDYSQIVRVARQTVRNRKVNQ